jgi:hypothetical protein
LADANEGFWGRIHDLYVGLASVSPPGMHAVVQIETGDGYTFEPSALQRYGDFLICEIQEETTEIVAVREADVRRVRIYCSEPAEEKVRVGFRVGDIKLDSAGG